MTDTTSRTQGDEARNEHRSSVAGTNASRRQLGVSRASLNKGYGQSMNRGFELALSIVVMVGIGWLLDRAVGTAPIFTVIFAIFGFVGATLKMWIGYDAEMRKLEDGAIWNRKAGRS